MKKLILIMLFNWGWLYSFAQSAVTESEAKAITANLMASFTEKVSFAYSKGISLERFKTNLLIKPTPFIEGNAMIERAYNYLYRSATRNQIIKEDNGKTVAAALRLLLKFQTEGIEPDGAELFGGREAVKISVQKEGCRWYQLLCHLTQLYMWITGWDLILPIIVYIEP